MIEEQTITQKANKEDNKKCTGKIRKIKICEETEIIRESKKRNTVITNTKKRKWKEEEIENEGEPMETWEGGAVAPPPTRGGPLDGIRAASLNFP